MPNTQFRPRLAVLAVVGAVAAAACQEPTSFVRHAAAPSFTTSSDVELLECPFPTGSFGTATIGPGGGTVVAGSSSIHIPPGALLAATPITVVESSSDLVEVEITAGNAEHFQFESPVTVTIGYSRCSPAATDGEVLGAWYIDGETKAPLEQMDATDDKKARRVVFATDHLSSYAVAH